VTRRRSRRRWLLARRGGACCFGGRVRGGERAGGSTPAVQVCQQVHILFFEGEIRVSLNLCLKNSHFGDLQSKCYLYDAWLCRLLCLFARSTELIVLCTSPFVYPLLNEPVSDVRSFCVAFLNRFILFSSEVKFSNYFFPSHLRISI
jgi:hypothetical protein